MSQLYDLTMQSITGDDVALGDYRGKVLLIVNVASA
jgi:glutathione peroxidase-family protein